MSEVKEIRSSGGGCFSWVLGRKSRNKPEAPQPMFVKSLSSKQILDKHTQGRWEPPSSKEELTLVEDLSQEGSYHSYASEKEEQEEAERFEGFGSDEDEDNTKHKGRSKGKELAAHVSSRLGSKGAHGGNNDDETEILSFDEDGGETASPSVLASVERDSAVRFGLSGGKVRHPTDAVSPKRGDKGPKVAVRRARRLEYGDEENDGANSALIGTMFDLEEEALPGGVHAALSPASKGRRRKEREDKKAWGQAVRSDWISGMR